jgi:adenylylsulfate kinase-like enzyme
MTSGDIHPGLQASGSVVWITGLSGAGKTTAACELVRRLRMQNQAVVMLDGDVLRELMGVADANVHNYGRDQRLALAMRYAQLCRLLAGQGLTVVIATISLFREVHAWNREHLPGYCEVYLKVPLEELRRRDPKGIYRRFETGELKDVAGLDLPVDEPEAADLVWSWTPGQPVEQLADELINLMSERKKP